MNIKYIEIYEKYIEKWLIIVNTTSKLFIFWNYYSIIFVLKNINNEIIICEIDTVNT